MSVETVISTVLGALLALGSVVVAQVLGSRDRRSEQSLLAQREVYLDFARAADAAYGGLRKLCEPGRTHDNLELAAAQAVTDSGVYRVRESTLLLLSQPINRRVEEVLRAVGRLERATADGAKLDTVAYHGAYHPLAEAMWALRREARRELGGGELQAEKIGKVGWDAAEDCDFCRAHTAPVGAEATTTT
jgi:hypothetical protein